MNYVKNYLTSEEAAEYLGTTLGGLRFMCARGFLRYYKPNGRKAYFAVKDLEDYIRSGDVIEPLRMRRLAATSN